MNLEGCMLLNESKILRHLLKVSIMGENAFAQPEDKDYLSVVERINSGRPGILFGSFWDHEHVKTFFMNYGSRLEPDSLVRYIYEVREFMGRGGRRVAWVEQVNLFHLIGLVRMLGGKDGAGELERMRLAGSDLVMSTIEEVSAGNIYSMLKEFSVKDAVERVHLFATRDLLQQYALYQIYYYNGVEHLFDVLSSYKDSEKVVVIPATIAGVYALPSHILKLGKLLEEKMLDEVLAPLALDRAALCV